jgi:hypothetical protein
MWSPSAPRFRRIVRLAPLLVALAAPLALAACSSFTPVYGENGINAQRVEIAYAPPSNRLEQIIYQDLALKLGKTSGDGVPRLVVAASQSMRFLTDAPAAQPGMPQRVTVAANVTLYGADGDVLFSGQRSAAADFTYTPQALAAQQAEADAAQRAARTLADTIRLQVLSVLR